MLLMCKLSITWGATKKRSGSEADKSRKYCTTHTGLRTSKSRHVTLTKNEEFLF